jgi:hypothetical protein
MKNILYYLKSFREISLPKKKLKQWALILNKLKRESLIVIEDVKAIKAKEARRSNAKEN